MTLWQCVIQDLQRCHAPGVLGRKKRRKKRKLRARPTGQCSSARSLSANIDNVNRSHWHIKVTNGHRGEAERGRKGQGHFLPENSCKLQVPQTPILLEEAQLQKATTCQHCSKRLNRIYRCVTSKDQRDVSATGESGHKMHKMHKATSGDICFPAGFQ